MNESQKPVLAIQSRLADCALIVLSVAILFRRKAPGQEVSLSLLSLCLGVVGVLYLRFVRLALLPSLALGFACIIGGVLGVFDIEDRGEHAWSLWGSGKGTVLLFVLGLVQLWISLDLKRFWARIGWV